MRPAWMSGERIGKRILRPRSLPQTAVEVGLRSHRERSLVAAMSLQPLDRHSSNVAAGKDDAEQRGAP
jgi:hypothetical protein